MMRLIFGVVVVLFCLTVTAEARCCRRTPVRSAVSVVRQVRPAQAVVKVVRAGPTRAVVRVAVRAQPVRRVFVR